MRKIVKANACYTGGGIYQYYGQFEDGAFFMTFTDWEDYVMVLDTDPEEDLEESAYADWADDHMIEFYENDKALEITKTAMEWILNNRPDGNYCPSEIQNALDSIEIEHKATVPAWNKMSDANVTVRQFLSLCGEENDSDIMLYECDERETIQCKVADLNDEKWHKLLDSYIASWDYDDGMLCIYYFLG